MKKILSSFFILIICSFGAQAGQNFRTMYLDFGPNDVTNGNKTLSPDKNGNYWNNVTDPATTTATVNLVDKTNAATGAYLNITAGFSKNGILNGGLLAPSDALLNDFAINTATQDYFFTDAIGRFSIKGLDKTKGYVFSMFGTRNEPEKRTSTFTAVGINKSSGVLQTSGINLGGTGYNGNNSTILMTDTIMPDSNGQINISLAKTEGTFAYLSILKINEVEACVADTFWKTKEPYHIAFMGSSVAYGAGATNNQGYAYMFKQMLSSRWAKNSGQNWNVTNVSIGGNNTTAIMNRWDTDLLPLCSKYVIYGLSLGNEGITTGGQAIYNQFRDNMIYLIKKARDKGIEPVVANCYTRGDYNATDYTFVKQMNMLMHEWNVATINVLGAIDNGAGQWATGYMYDSAHPNNSGHIEFKDAIVPSLFDAMDAGKPQPQMVDGTSLRLKPDSADYRLEFTAEESLHPFTLSFDIQTSSTGPIAQFKTTSGQCALSIENNGSLNYTSAKSIGIQGSNILNDNQWHKVTLTHYYAMGKTFLYVDKVLQGSIAERLISTTFNLGAFGAPAGNFRKLMFYRAGMNALEVAALVDQKMLKSSLEIFAPLDEKGITGTDTLVNLAQSTNKVFKVKIVDPGMGLSNQKISSNLFQFYPNPAKNHLLIKTNEVFDTITIIDMNGKSIKKIEGHENKVDISSLSPGVYFLKLSGKKCLGSQKFIKTVSVS